jgi:hypothetical protein
MEPGTSHGRPHVVAHLQVTEHVPLDLVAWVAAEGEVSNLVTTIIIDTVNPKISQPMADLR